MPYSDSRVDSEYYHGTHIAGIIGAIQNNFLGVTGISPGVKLMVLRVRKRWLDSLLTSPSHFTSKFLLSPSLVQVSDCMSGSIQASTAFQAFDYALKMGAHIVSCSFGGSYAYGFVPTTKAPAYHTQWSQAYVTALQPLASKGILAVVSAGQAEQ